ncbi:lck-interacting transmembrane adapter 1 [Pezoporus wallicus]|uniref:lck-interacting transmembrane adapter 1 n=1 Tax=Pezoporus wallicus TaxID=35540 RepID=UPI0025513F99|nr:lck-interacting transmembrane adapter 1 [Pezoporus wallicus]XP_061297656.1 lck-interacting transmembrane adapter 1 [Pezoporus flaviventris]
MAAAGGEGPEGTPLLPAGAALALLGGLVYLGALCAACRRKSRKKQLPPDGVKLVDESLLRQTQLRSLSKSDTKLHELYRVKAGGHAQRPASLDFTSPAPADPQHGAGVLLHRELPQIPVPEPPDQTYSNLLFPPRRRPAPDTVYECVATGGEEPPVSPPRAVHGAADYACVRKVKKGMPAEEQDAAAAVGPPQALQCCDGSGSAPQAKLEEMYSTVCKATKKKTQVPASPPGEEGAQARSWSPAAHGPLDPCYESINDRAWTIQGRGPDPDYEAVDVNWKRAAKRDKAPENLYESVGDIWAGGSQRAAARMASNGLEVYITNL